MMSKLKDFFVYSLDKCKATVSYVIMTRAVNTVVYCHINHKVNNKLVSGLTDQWVQVSLALFFANHKMTLRANVLFVSLSPLDASALNTQMGSSAQLCSHQFENICSSSSPFFPRDFFDITLRTACNNQWAAATGLHGDHGDCSLTSLFSTGTRQIIKQKTRNNL